MHVTLDITTAEEYFAKTDREVDWDHDLDKDIPEDQANALQDILTIEVSIYVLRRVTGLCGMQADVMASLRQSLICEYEIIYEPYILYRDFS